MTEGAQAMADGYDAGQDNGYSAGQLLKAAREAHGLHIAALAVSLKVPVKKLELLEADRFDELPDAVFARALASSVCRSLKVDPSEILSKLPQTHRPVLANQTHSINTPFRMPSNAPAPSAMTALSKPAGLAVIALLLGALVLVFLPDISQKTSDAASSALNGLKGAAPGSLPTSDNTGTAMGAGSVLTNDGGVKLAGADTLTLGSTPTVAVAAPTAASSTVAATDGAAVDGLVVFRAKGESWVEVIDARGQVTLRKLLAAGESAAANGTVPLRVTVGRADQTTVTVRGKPFDGESLVRDNVLRFEVK
jgi:cytoskeleton protein RodZ